MSFGGIVAEFHRRLIERSTVFNWKSYGYWRTNVVRSTSKHSLYTCHWSRSWENPQMERNTRSKAESMSLSRADVKRLTLKSLWGWKRWFENTMVGTQGLRNARIKFARSLVWPGFSAFFFLSLASHFAASYKKMLLFQRSFIFPILSPLFLRAFQTRIGTLWHARITYNACRRKWDCRTHPWNTRFIFRTKG